MPTTSTRLPVLPSLETWGGVEATVNRVRDTYLDQNERSGHAQRLDDMDRFAALGIRALRYPVLWERVAPDGLERADWRWTDERLSRLRELSIRPIAGLVHHGSGPRATHLLDDGFAPGLAAYASAVAERYPWVNAYTPVNEPLTTARFSALYGHWYPHASDGRSWAQALLNECRATVLAMRAIREVNPSAQLIQTEDLGKTHSTSRLAYQAEFENERRWLTFDLLCGRVTPGHRMWQYLTWLGVSERDLTWFVEHPCPPNIIGINHYVTSERFLDERIERYPLRTHGGNGHDTYADIEAARVRAQGIEGPGALLWEGWDRYQLPLAVTEAHLYSTREEQMRWLLEVWRGAQAARKHGADVRAVTAWSLLVAYNWVNLVTKDEGHYEPGAFDLRAPAPRATALTRVIRDLASGREPRDAVLAEPGWWRRPRTRLEYRPVRSIQQHGPLALHQRRFSMRRGKDGALLRGGSSRRPLLITRGPQAEAFARLCDLRGIVYRLQRLEDHEADCVPALRDLLDDVRPWAVVHTGRYPSVDRAEQDLSRCFHDNVDVPAALAAACAAQNVPLVTFSSDLVFDGGKREPYVESDQPAPRGVFATTCRVAEEQVLQTHAGALVVRPGAAFNPWDDHDPLNAALDRLAAGRPCAAPDGQVVSPTYVPDLVNAALDLLIDGETGIWHLANEGACTWLELVERAAAAAGLDTACLEPAPAGMSAAAGPRPAYTALASERATLLPPLDAALARYVDARRATGARWTDAGADAGEIPPLRVLPGVA